MVTNQIANKSNVSQIGSGGFGYQHSSYGVVDEVILNREDLTDKDEIGAIRFSFIKTSSTGERSSSNKAYPQNGNQIELPLRGEVVKIFSGPYYNKEKNSIGTRLYYANSINVWNTPSYNPIPDPNAATTEVEPEVKENENLPIAELSPGDFLLQGRLGQSLRFTGYNYDTNVYSNERNDTYPLTILRNSKSNEQQHSIKTFNENANVDDSIIYLTSLHKVPLTTIHQKGITTYVKKVNDNINLEEEKEPDTAEVFEGKQIVLKSDRVHAYAKNDSIILESKESIKGISKSINLDAINYLAVDAPYIFLGNEAKRGENTLQPAIKGEVLYNLLKNLIDDLTDFCNKLSLLSDPNSTPGQVVKAANTFKDKLSNKYTKKDYEGIKNIQSKKIFIE